MRFWSLEGQVPYESASRLQRGLVDLRARDSIPDTVLFLEHEAVITRGRGLQFTGATRERHMPAPAPLPPGIAFAESERGGDLTYHGPGQLVVYPILKLDGRGFAPRHDVTGFLRGLERIFIEELASLGLRAEARERATGVWVGDRKLASIGIAVRKWVTWHGLAINVVNDLGPFRLISPCGFSPEVMTRLADLVPLGTLVEPQQAGLGTGLDGGWRPWLECRLAGRFEAGAEIRRLGWEEAMGELSTAAPSWLQ